MGTTKNILMQEFNGTDYDLLLPETDAYAKEEALSAMVKKYLKLNDVSTPSDAFLKLIFGVDAKLYQVKVIFPDGTPVSNINIGGLTAPSGFNMVTDDNGQVIRKNTSANPTVTAYTRFLDYKTTKVVAQTVEEGITNVVITLEEQPLNEVLYLDSSISNYSIRRDAIKYIDWTVQGGGQAGSSSLSGQSWGVGVGRKGGKTGHALNISISPQDIISVSVPRTSNIEVLNKITINNISYPQKEAPLDGKNNPNYIFNEQALGRSGGGDGAYGTYEQAHKEGQPVSVDPAGTPNGGEGGIVVEDYYTSESSVWRSGSAGTFPRGGGGRAASTGTGATAGAGSGSAGRVYYRLKTAK